MFKFYYLVLVCIVTHAAYSQTRPTSASKNPFATSRGSLVDKTEETGLITNELYITKSGLTSLLLSLGIPYGTIDSSASGGSIETKSGTETSFELAHGLTDRLNIYGSFVNVDRRSSFNTTPETTAHSIGLGDVILGIKGISDKTTNWFYYDANYIYPTIKPNNTELITGEISPGSLRPSYNFKIGFGLPNPSFTFGLNYTYSMYQKSESTTTNYGAVASTTTHNSGSGMSWQFFLQSNTTWRYGFSYKETRTNSYEKTTSGVTSTNNASTVLLPSIYLLTPMGPAADLIFSVYKPIIKNSSAKQNYYMGYAQLRLLF